MLKSLWNATSGLKSHQTWMDSVGHNIANVNTTAYKANEVSFQDTLYQNMNRPSAATDNSMSTNGRQVGLGTSLAATHMNITERGSMITTNEPLDMMINGNSFFVVHGPDQDYYTKDGNFVLDVNGNLTMAGNGYYVYGWTSQDGKTIDKNSELGPINFFGAGTTGDYKAGLYEPTSNIVFNGNIDQNDSDYTATDGELRSVQVTNTNGERFNLQFSVKSNEDGSFTMTAQKMSGVNGDVNVSGVTPITLSYDYKTGQFQSANGNADGLVNVNIPQIGDVTMDFSKTTGISTLGDNVQIDHPLPDWVTLSNTDLEPDGRTYLSDTQRITLLDSDGTDRQYSASRLDFGNGFNKADLIGSGFHTTCCTCNAYYSFSFNEGKGNTVESSGGHLIYSIDISQAQTAEDVVDAIINGLNQIGETEGTDANPNGHFTNLRKDPANPTSLIVYDNREGMESGGGFGLIGKGIATRKSADSNLSTLNLSADGGAMNGYSVDDSGHVYVTYSGSNQPRMIGQIAVALFDNPFGLERNGENLYETTQNSGNYKIHDVKDEGQSIKVGVLEASNVNLADEFTDMILSQRGFQLNSRAITTSDQMLETLNGLKQ